MANFVIAAQIIGIIVILVALRLLVSGGGSREHVLMGYFLGGSLIQNVGYLLELTAPTKEVAVMALRVENLGSVFVPLCYCIFIFGYCFEKVPALPMKLLAALDALILPVMFWSDRHTLIYRRMDWLETPHGQHYLSLEYGPLYLPVMAVRIVIPYVLTIYALTHTVLVRSSHRERKQCLSFLLASFLPVVALVVYVAKLTNVYDLTPLVLGLTLSLVVILVWSRRNYDFHKLAADAVLDGISDGVIALDARRRLVSYNQAAADIFVQLRGRRPGESVGDVEELREELLEEDAPRQFSIGDRFYESHARRIMDSNGILQGYALLLLDMTDTHDYIGQITRMQAQAQAAGKDFQLSIQIKNRIIKGDPARLGQIVNNLVSNAMKFTSRGDRISISVRQMDEGRRNNYLFTVSDTGAGMSEEFLPKIFEPYEREILFGAKAVMGTGLGMPIVKNLISRMGGQITVSSTLGKGSTFSATIPFDVGEILQPAQEETHQELIQLDGRRILLAEDNFLNMEIAPELLQMRGAQVTPAENGQLAVEAFQRESPFFFDAILMDMQMPEMDGCQATEAIRALNRPDAQTVPIIALTANAFAEDISRTAQAGMNAHLAKPINIELLCTTLTELMPERTGVHEKDLLTEEE